MSWSVRLGRVAGIPIYLHWTFIILVASLVLGSWLLTQDLIGALEGGAFVLSLFGCVVLHELGHALTARHFGIPTQDITLLPIGGVARLQRMPEKPIQELIVALAGPAVNVVIAGLLFGVFGVRMPEEGLEAPKHLVEAPFWPKLMEVNLFLAAFNMLPAFPMDGGRVLRALLAMQLPYSQATRLAATVGQWMAILFGLIGLTIGHPLLLLIALFVWIGAEGEAVQVEERIALSNVLVREAMLTDFHTLHPDDTLGYAADLLLAGTQQDFPIVSSLERGVEGLLTRSELLSGLARAGRDAPVKDFAKTDVPSVEADSPLAAAVTKLREGPYSCLQVVEDGTTVGLLTLENIGELLMVRSALGQEGGPRDRSLVGTGT
jgi:Zn-dependent protease/CBS domain-containing protein